MCCSILGRFLLPLAVMLALGFTYRALGREDAVHIARFKHPDTGVWVALFRFADWQGTSRFVVERSNDLKYWTEVRAFDAFEPDERGISILIHFPQRGTMSYYRVRYAADGDDQPGHPPPP